MAHLIKTITTLFLCITLFGCSSLADTRMAEGTGQKQTFNKDFDVVWRTSIDVLNTMNLPLAEENKSQGYILAKTGVSFGSYGENIAVFIKKSGANQVTVEVVSKRVLATTIFAPDWSQDILQRISARLN